MTWIQTYRGKVMDVFDPDITQIDIIDIAHSLSNQCRYNGHCDHFYSVARHCCLCASIMAVDPRSMYRMRWSRKRKQYEISSDQDKWSPDMHRQIVFHALMHDAAEAYVGDMPRPIKRKFPEFKKIEASLMDMVISRMGMVPLETFPGVAELIHQIDMRMCVTERDAMLSEPPIDWNLDYEPYEALIENIRSVVEDPAETKKQFLHWVEWCRNLDMPEEEAPIIGLAKEVLQ